MQILERKIEIQCKVPKKKFLMHMHGTTAINSFFVWLVYYAAVCQLMFHLKDCDQYYAGRKTRQCLVKTLDHLQVAERPSHIHVCPEKNASVRRNSHWWHWWESPGSLHWAVRLTCQAEWLRPSIFKRESTLHLFVRLYKKDCRYFLGVSLLLCLTGGSCLISTVFL